MSLAEILSAALLTLSGLGCLYLTLAIVLVLWLRATRHSPDVAATPAVSLLKPLHGAEPGLYDNLATFLRQDYPGSVEAIFGVQNGQDPAIGVVRQLQRDFPGAAIRLVVDATSHGTNRKVSNLINMEREIRHEVVLLADSDMRVGPDYLRRVTAELARPGVGAVTLLYNGLPTASVWSRLAALGIDAHFLPNVVVGTTLGMAKPCFGSTIALGRGTLEAIGGFRAVANELADDYVVGSRVRDLGLSVAIPAFTVGHACHERGVADLVRQELRWARTVRQLDPGGHAGSVLVHPFALALLAWMLGANAAPVFVLAAIALRIGLCLAAERAFGVWRHDYWLVPLRDLASFGIFVTSFLGRDVSWRGHRYSVAPGGALIADDEALNPR